MQGGENPIWKSYVFLFQTTENFQKNFFLLSFSKCKKEANQEANLVQAYYIGIQVI